jgi:hypothetical protein
MQFGQVGVGENSDHCSPVQVKFPIDQVFSLYKILMLILLFYPFEVGQGPSGIIG